MTALRHDIFVKNVGQYGLFLKQKLQYINSRGIYNISVKLKCVKFMDRFLQTPVYTKYSKNIIFVLNRINFTGCCFNFAGNHPNLRI